MKRRTFIRGLVRVAPIVVVPHAALEALTKGRSMVGWGRGLEGGLWVDSSGTLRGLQPGTWYDIRVRNYGDGTMSAWVNGQPFQTGALEKAGLITFGVNA